MHTFTVPDGSQKRLDAFLSANMESTSRARLQNMIKDGYVAVNGKPASKAGQGIRKGDTVTCEVPPVVPVEAAPEVSCAGCSATLKLTSTGWFGIHNKVMSNRAVKLPTWHQQAASKIISHLQ